MYFGNLRRIRLICSGGIKRGGIGLFGTFRVRCRLLLVFVKSICGPLNICINVYIALIIFLAFGL